MSMSSIEIAIENIFIQIDNIIDLTSFGIGVKREAIEENQATKMQTN